MSRTEIKAHGGCDSRIRGFTLVELMITLLILGLILGVVYRMFSSQEHFFRTQEQVAATQENLRATVEYMNQELSWLGYRVPGVAVVKASPNDLIFRANIPNTGSSIQYVRYRFDSASNTILRAAGANPADVDTADVMMASDIEALSFSFHTVDNAVVPTSPTDPLCSDALSSTACSPGAPETVDNRSLQMIHRVKARVVARSPRPDWQYTDPSGGANPNYRKRAAVLDVKARNVEDATIVAGQLVSGQCGVMTHVITPPAGGVYNACRDKVSMLATGLPNMDNGWSDNPAVTITAYDMNGQINTNPARIAYVYAVGADSGTTPFNVYDPTDFSVDNAIDTGQTRYISAQELSSVGAGNKIIIQFAYSDGICTQVLYDGNQDILIGPDAPSQFDTSGLYGDGGITVKYVDLQTGHNLTLPSPVQVAMCSSAAHQGVALETRILDECLNPIAGEAVTWDDGGAGGTFIDENDNGDGTYSAVYVPPATMAPTASEHLVTLSAHWGAITLSTEQILVPYQPVDIVIDEITDVLNTNGGMFNFTRTVDNTSGSTFAIERIDGQDIGIRFHLEDACGNRVFNQGPNLTLTTSTGYPTSGLVSNPDGSYYFEWAWGGGCGAEVLNQNITISASSISDPARKNEVIAFSLPETMAHDPLAGPFVLMDKVNDPGLPGLRAGNTSDFVDLTAQVTQYHPEEQYCSNIPGVWPVEFTSAGGPGGNGSFKNTASFDQITQTVNTDGGTGIAQVRLFSGTADWDDTLSLTAAANVAGKVFQGTIDVGMHETNHPQAESGIYSSSSYVTEIGEGQGTTTFKPGRDLYLQIRDWDENENPLQFDDLACGGTSLTCTTVAVESKLTGDRVMVFLKEYGGGSINSGDFREALETSFSATANLSDSVLQVLDGDTVTVYYKDKDNPGDSDTWTVYAPGADFFNVYKVETDGSETETLLTGGPSLQAPVVYGDHVRPKLSLPFLASDGRIESDTVQISVDTGSEVTVLTLREEQGADSGILVPDWDLYNNDFIAVSQTDPTSAPEILLTPTTPRYVNLTYSVPGAYEKTTGFFMKDMDPPTVEITAPADGAVVSGLVEVLVAASDVGNATSWAGISRVDLYVNGRFIAATSTESSPGVYAFTWRTAEDGLPYWLDGSHTLTARAVDNGNNEAWSDPVSVTVSNGLSPIWFSEPAQNSIWSGEVTLGIGVSMAAEAGTYDVVLVNSTDMGSVIASWTDAGSRTFTHSYDTTGLTEGRHTLVATLTGTEGMPRSTNLDVIVDRTGPSISIGYPMDQAWINLGTFPATFSATVSDPRVDPADPNDVVDASVTGAFSGICSSSAQPMTPGAGDTYTLFRELSLCGGVEGMLTFTVEAYDTASPANHSSVAETAMVDTVRPMVNEPLSVSTIVGGPVTLGTNTIEGFLRGTTGLSATVTETWPYLGEFLVQYYQDAGSPASPAPSWTDPVLLGPVDASSRTFGFSWDTGSYPNGIYPIWAGVIDLAGNSNATSPVRLVYVDNAIPWASVPSLDIPMGIVRGPVYVDWEANDSYGFLATVEHRFFQAGADPDTATPWHTQSVESFGLVELVRTVSGTYVLDTSPWPNGDYVGYAYATDFAGNRFRSGPTATFTVEIKLLEAGSLSATFTSVGPDQFVMSANGRIVDATGNGVAGEDLNLLAYRYIRSCIDATCTSYNYSLGGSYSDNTQTTNASGYFTFNVPAASITFENPVPGHTLPDLYYVYVRDSSNRTYGTLYGYLDDPPLQAVPSQYVTTQSSMISNLSTSLDPYGADWRITVAGNLIRVDGQPVEYGTIRFRTEYFDTMGGTYELDPASGYFETMTGDYGEFSIQLSTAFPTGPYFFYVDMWDDNGRYLGYLYQPSPTPNPGSITFHPY